MQTANVIVAIIAAYLFCFGVMALLVDARRIQVGGLHAMGMGTILLGLSYVIQLAFDAPGLRLADVVNHTLSTMGPIMLLVGVRRFLGMPVPSTRLLWGMAAAYTLAQVLVSLAVGDFHRYTLLSACAVAIFVYLSLTSWQASTGIARDLRLALRTLGTISLGFAFLHGMKAVFVLRDGAAALDLGRWHQIVFYAYMAAMAVVVVPLVMWMVFKRLTAALEQAAVRDPLTGALNRRGMQQRLEEHLAGRNGPGACLLLLDVDHFKAINDAHGHQVGDQVLVRLAQELSAGVRKGDFVAQRRRGVHRRLPGRRRRGGDAPCPAPAHTACRHRAPAAGRTAAAALHGQHRGVAAVPPHRPTGPGHAPGRLRPVREQAQRPQPQPPGSAAGFGPGLNAHRGALRLG